MARHITRVEDETYEGALKKGLSQLDATESDVTINILQEGQSGFLGFLSRSWKLEIRLLEALQAEREEAVERDKPRPVDADYRLTNQPEGVFMMTTPAEFGGRRLDYQTVNTELRQLGLTRIDVEGLRAAIDPSNCGALCQVAPYQEGFNPDRDCQVMVEVDRSRMEVRIRITRPFGEGKRPEVKEVVDRVRQEGIKVDIDGEAISTILEEKRWDELFLVGVGLPPVHGQNGKIRWKVGDEEEKVRVNIQEDGTVDFHKVLQINNIRAGEIIGERVEATVGVDGYDVYRNLIPAKPGRSMVMAAGKNVELSEDGLRFTAAIDGQVLIKTNVPHVMPVFEVRGNVDISTGDIDFVGNVIVHGNVDDGFEVRADGNVDVRGTVNCSSIRATGNVIIQGGFLGKEKGEIHAEQSVGVKFVENGIIHAQEDVIVEKAIMHSHIVAGRRVQVKGRKGLIVGGSITAGEEVDAINIGSPMGTRTIIFAGVPLAKKERIQKLDEEMAEIHQNLEKIGRTLELFQRMLRSTGRLSPEQEILHNKSLTIAGQLHQRKKELEEERLHLVEEIEKSAAGRVICHNAIHPGVSVTIKTAVLLVNDVVRCSALELKDGAVRVGVI